MLPINLEWAPVLVTMAVKEQLWAVPFANAGNFKSMLDKEKEKQHTNLI